jgi:lipopolysaccharide transport system permease protein/teichoic acid transport system permease protein
MLDGFLRFFRLIVRQRRLIVSMARREIAMHYVGSLLGFMWTFIQPMVMILVFWFVFSVGFKTKPMNDVPFVVWLTAGMAPWFAFADVVTGATGMIVDNAHLIKKTVFPSQILPVVRLVSSFVTHAVFLVVLLGLILFQRLPFSWYYLQFIYYLGCLSVLVLGLGWALSALKPFVRDIGQIVAIVVQIGFWATPIFWDINIMPAAAQQALKLNPMYYIIQGYRDSFLYFVPFWHHPWLTAYFWFVAAAAFVLGALIFRRLKPQFADVL